jgi:hypothetical protein
MRGDVVELLELLVRSKIGRRFGTSFASRDIDSSFLGGKSSRKILSNSQKNNTKMPPTKEGNSQPIKRKRPAASSKPLKRARSESSDEDVQEQILILENDIHESKKNYNNIVKLVSKLRDPEEAVIAAISLCRVFTRLMVSGDMAKKKDTTEKDAVVIGWLRERYKDYKSGLVALLAEEEIASTVLTVCMRILETEGRYLRNSSEYTFPEGFLTDIVRVLVEPGNDERTRLDFSQKFVEEYDDVRYYTLEALELVLDPLAPCQSLTFLTGRFYEMPKTDRNTIKSSTMRCRSCRPLSQYQNPRKNWRISTSLHRKSQHMLYIHFLSTRHEHKAHG